MCDISDFGKVDWNEPSSYLGISIHIPSSTDLVVRRFPSYNCSYKKESDDCLLYATLFYETSYTDDIVDDIIDKMIDINNLNMMKSPSKEVKEIIEEHKVYIKEGLNICSSRTGKNVWSLLLSYLEKEIRNVIERFISKMNKALNINKEDIEVDIEGFVVSTLKRINGPLEIQKVIEETLEKLKYKILICFNIDVEVEFGYDFSRNALNRTLKNLKSLISEMCDDYD